MECPKCGGETWDNRQKKADGAMSPRAPDVACKDKENCGWVQWPPRDKKGGFSGKGGGNGATPPQKREPTRIISQAEVELFWKVQYAEFKQAFAIASKVIGGSKLPGDAIGAAQDAATGLMIALARYRQQPPAQPVMPAVKAVQPVPKMPLPMEEEGDYEGDNAPWDD